MTAVPVTILTGFLGAGKTTLLREVLRDPRFADAAVIVNEFGEIGLDHELIDTADEGLVEATTGCLCCTVQGDVRRTVRSLLTRARAGAVRPFSRIIIETTGLADPAPVLHTFISDAEELGVTLAGAVALVDIVNGDATLDRFEEARRQVACADVVALTKTDLVADPASRRDLAALGARIRAMNATGRLVDLHADALAPGDLFASLTGCAACDGAELIEWLRFEADARAHGDDGHGHGHGHEHGHGAGHRHGGGRSHNPNRHGDDIEAHCFAFDAPLRAQGFWFALNLLRELQGERLLRVKGLVALDDAPDRPFALHGVQHIFNEPVRLDAWPSDDRRTRLVVIAQGLPANEIRGMFAMFESVDARRAEEVR